MPSHAPLPAFRATPSNHSALNTAAGFPFHPDSLLPDHLQGSLGRPADGGLVAGHHHRPLQQDWVRCNAAIRPTTSLRVRPAAFLPVALNSASPSRSRMRGSPPSRSSSVSTSLAVGGCLRYSRIAGSTPCSRSSASVSRDLPQRGLCQRDPSAHDSSSPTITTSVDTIACAGRTQQRIVNQFDAMTPIEDSAIGRRRLAPSCCHRLAGQRPARRCLPVTASRHRQRRRR